MSELEQILNQPVLRVAPRILGSILRYQSPQGNVVSGQIVEVEAYRQDDPASHSFRPVSVRTQPLFESAGSIYMYFIYGIHYCLNIVTGPKGQGEALLIRALQPLEGLDVMRRHRKQTDPRALCSGPAKLVQALGLPKTLNGGSFLKDPLRLELQSALDPAIIAAVPRIGISKATDKLWRFCIKDSPFLSVPIQNKRPAVY